MVALLERLYDATDGPARIPHDPVRAVHRYDDPADREIAGFLAAGMAFGRVDLFLPVLDRLLDVLDQHGGPAQAVRAWTPADDARVGSLGYRWIRAADLGVVLDTLGRQLRTTDRLEDALGDGPEVRTRIAGLVDRLRTHAIDAIRARHAAVSDVRDLPRGVRTFLPSPRDGSACKRLNLWVRWMVRPPREGVDVGQWQRIRPSELVMPLDVHVGRLSRFLGLTQRTDASWRTAQEIAHALSTIDPDDPVRFDFALAHHGISRACRGHRDAAVCPTCVLDPACRAPA